MLAAVGNGVLMAEAVEPELLKAGTGGSCTRNSGAFVLALPTGTSSVIWGVFESADGRDGASVIGVSLE